MIQDNVWIRGECDNIRKTCDNKNKATTQETLPVEKSWTLGLLFSDPLGVTEILLRLWVAESTADDCLCVDVREYMYKGMSSLWSRWSVRTWFKSVMFKQRISLM